VLERGHRDHHADGRGVYACVPVLFSGHGQPARLARRGRARERRAHCRADEAQLRGAHLGRSRRPQRRWGGALCRLRTRYQAPQPAHGGGGSDAGLPGSAGGCRDGGRLRNRGVRAEHRDRAAPDASGARSARRLPTDPAGPGDRQAAPAGGSDQEQSHAGARGERGGDRRDARRPARRRRRHRDPRAVPAPDAPSPAGAALRDTRGVRSRSRAGSGARLPRMRVGASGALELSRRAGAQPQQRRPRQPAPGDMSLPGTAAACTPRVAAARAAAPAPLIRRLGRVEYEPTWRAMQRFTEERGAATPDEIWFLEHPPVYTLGVNASRAHLLAPGDIPVVQVDRGGEVTYHGPGQLVVYPLVDLTRAGVAIREFITALERGVIDLAAQFGIRAECRRGAPGVYVDGRKLASLGVRVRRGGSYHGLAVNVALDLEPFRRINPCGYQGLQMTQLAELGGPRTVSACARALEPHLLRAFGYRVTPP